MSDECVSHTQAGMADIVSGLCMYVLHEVCAAGEAMFYNLHTLCFCELSTEAEETAEH
jgi:hypothetical protein